MQTTQKDLHILILAAGASSRMAPRDKLLETVEGQPLLMRITRFALETGMRVSVVLPPDKPLRHAAIARLPVQRIIAEAARDGMANSLLAGLKVLPSTADILLLLADLPEITSADLATMIAARAKYPGRILRATSASGQPGHPVIFPAQLRPELMSLRGDEGARRILQPHAATIVPIALPAEHAVTDLDTAEDWDRWRKKQDIR